MRDLNPEEYLAVLGSGRHTLVRYRKLPLHFRYGVNKPLVEITKGITIRFIA